MDLYIYINTHTQIHVISCAPLSNARHPNMGRRLCSLQDSTSAFQSSCKAHVMPNGNGKCGVDCFSHVFFVHAPSAGTKFSMCFFSHGLS